MIRRFLKEVRAEKYKFKPDKGFENSKRIVLS